MNLRSSGSMPNYVTVQWANGVDEFYKNLRNKRYCTAAHPPRLIWYPKLMAYINSSQIIGYCFLKCTSWPQTRRHGIMGFHYILVYNHTSQIKIWFFLAYCALICCGKIKNRHFAKNTGNQFFSATIYALCYEYENFLIWHLMNYKTRALSITKTLSMTKDF